MNTTIKSLAIFYFMISLTACGPSTHLTKTWTDPSVNSATWKPFTKVLVIARMKDETGNRIAEDKMVQQFKPGGAVPSYSYLSAADTVQGSVDARLKKDGFDGLVLMRLIDVQESMNVSSTGYGGAYGYGGYYGGYYGMNHGMTTVSVDHDYLVETRIYTLSPGMLVWSGTTSTFNPSSLSQGIDEIIAADKAQLLRQGLIKQ